MEVAKDVVRILFWSWLVISMVILVRRSLRSDDRKADASPSPPLPPGTTMALSDGAGPVDPTSAGSSIFDEPGGDTHLPDPVGPSRPVAAMVRGITLPCNLTPVATFVPRPGAADVAVFSTTSHPPATVGQEVGAELRRLGFDLQARHRSEALATKGDDTLHVEVHAAPDSIDRSGQAAFPTSTPGAVVVEFWTD